jgi:hypothetical protein
MIVAAALAALTVTSACRKVDDGKMEVEKPVVGTQTDTVHYPSLDVTTDSTTIAVPDVDIKKDSAKVKVPKIKVKKNDNKTD